MHCHIVARLEQKIETVQARGEPKQAFLDLGMRADNVFRTTVLRLIVGYTRTPSLKAGRKPDAIRHEDALMTTIIENGFTSPIRANSADRLCPLLRCPRGRGGLDWTAASVACAACGVDYPRGEGRPDFANATLIESEVAEFQQERMYHRSLRGQLYDVGQRIITSEYAPYDHRARFLAELPRHAIVVELGSGNRRLADKSSTSTSSCFPMSTLRPTSQIVPSPMNRWIT